MEGNVRESHNARNVICGGGVFLCTKKLYNLFTCCRSRMEGNVRESHNARNVICGGGVILGTKIKQLQRDTYWKCPCWAMSY